MAINILVTEDEIIVRKDIERCLTQLGYNIIATADNGKDAISLALKHKPDICLMDIMIKGDMSGIEAAQEIKSNIDVPVIFLTDLKFKINPKKSQRNLRDTKKRQRHRRNKETSP